eukprot:670670-Prymnesium_polylepis.1
MNIGVLAQAVEVSASYEGATFVSDLHAGQCPSPVREITWHLGHLLLKQYRQAPVPSPCHRYRHAKDKSARDT